ncbi:hypothetical protein DFS28_101337 [Pseudomonas sp. 478]|uniref:GTPase-associated system all-helical protein GASH n=1 Tax=unclassified Pseudomonas TaxID=196821 RepID=UPI000DAF3200|nr:MULTISPECIES: GTPase-associated system all-helical protein GASH [unclassified Pseudomonas]PZX01987.1 hypothetical protein DFS28_101337 [Pseudomonas sp. 478]TCV52082.1 hypothetical protein EDB99_106119 [Pseudomonas sp. 460]
MADSSVREMHPEFARWISVIGFGDEVARRQARWEGVVAIADDFEQETIETLIRLAYQSKQKANAEIVDSLRKTFKDIDETFDLHGNDRELQVLAGICLAVIMELGSGQGASAALAVTTTAFAGARTTDLPMDLCTLAESAIVKAAEFNRTRPVLAPTPGTVKADFDSAIAKLKEQPDATGMVLALQLASAATTSAITQTAQRQIKTIKSLCNFVKIQDEELQMLWWLIGQHSTDYDKAFESIPTELQPMVFAKELSDATTLTPGPASIKSLLSRAGLKGRKKITISSAINSAEKKWLQGLVDESISPVTTPLHFAIIRQLETDGGDAWVSNWAAVTGIADHELTPMTLGTLFYRERLLLLFE